MNDLNNIIFACQINCNYGCNICYAKFNSICHRQPKWVLLDKDKIRLFAAIAVNKQIINGRDNKRGAFGETVDCSDTLGVCRPIQF